MTKHLTSRIGTAVGATLLGVLAVVGSSTAAYAYVPVGYRPPPPVAAQPPSVNPQIWISPYGATTGPSNLPWEDWVKIAGTGFTPGRTVTVGYWCNCSFPNSNPQRPSALTTQVTASSSGAIAAWFDLGSCYYASGTVYGYARDEASGKQAPSPSAPVPTCAV